MNVFKLEEIRKILNQKLTEEKSPRFCLLLITDYFEEVLSYEDQTILSAYLPEFIPNYIKYLRAYSPQGLHPKKTERIISIAKKILSAGLSEEEKKKIKDAVAGIKAGLSFLKAVLDGADVEEEISFNTAEGKRLAESVKAFVSFPVLERVTDKDVSLGLLENLSVMIQKKNLNDPNSFEIIPGSRELDEKLKGQIHSSWNVAKKYVAGKIKITHSHTAIIRFNNKYGEYVGDSLGAALTLAFIGELLKTHNAREQITVSAAAAFTGSLRENGEVGEVTDGIVSKKTETVFFSSAEIFVVPKEDENAALDKLNKLKKEFPKRNLKVVPVETLDDILMRRDLVDIRKQNIAFYSAKKAYTPKFAFTFMLAVVLMVAALLYEKFDDNPSLLEYKNGYLNVLNRMGDTLWTTKSGPERLEKSIFAHERKYYSRLIDVNNDGQNEVLLCGEDKNNSDDPDHK
ncbi:MAG: hypothetical protein GXO87_04465, partial [Chlorobi bacterium]|nr:hypothetical protein [Chlorobiota bacterium]